MSPTNPIAPTEATATAVSRAVTTSSWFTATQREVAPDKLARVSSLDFLTSYGLAPVGLALIAPAIDTFGVTAVLGTCALASFPAPAVAAAVPTARGFSRTTATRTAKG